MPFSKSFLIRIQPKLLADLRATAAARGQTISAYIRQATRQRINRHSTQEPADA